MSNQWPGGFVTKNPPVPSGPYADSTAQGLWTLSQQAGYRKQDLWPTQGNANPDSYIENLFSTYLYAGNGATQTINNGIDVSGKGGLVWIKDRTVGYSHSLFDTVRGVTNRLLTNGTGEQISYPTSVTAFNSNGFTTGDFSNTNSSGSNLVSWTFREKSKFFDIATWTGTGSARTIAHNLGSVPGCIIVKELTVGATNWCVYHRGTATPQSTNIYLNDTSAASATNFWDNTSPTSAVFSLGTSDQVNGVGSTYVAYIFAHDAGGFGVSGNDNVISCGSYTVSTLAQITLGYEPQFLLVRKISGTGSQWYLLDSMRGFSLTNSAYLRPNVSSIESSSGSPGFFSPTATGFIDNNQVFTNGDDVIYIAIRRGPMAVPTLGTTVFAPVVQTPSGVTTVTTGFPSDLSIFAERVKTAIGGNIFFDRLRGTFKTYSVWLYSQSTSQETIQASNGMGFDSNTTIVDNISAPVWGVNSSSIYWNFKRAPSVFDIVCYTGTGGASQTFAHNLGVAPELVIVKCRSDAAAWESLGTALNSSQRQIYLNRTQAGVAVASGHLGWNGTDGAYKAPTNTLVYFGGDSDVGGAGLPYVAYLFATCPGVSKVGSYTGTGTTQAINCGFTAGARFVMIKRTDSTGDWYVWDSARGIVAGNDPYLSMNTTASEVTSTDYIDTSAAGFEITSTAPADINAVGGSYIFLAFS